MYKKPHTAYNGQDRYKIFKRFHIQKVAPTTEAAVFVILNLWNQAIV